jgi:hypothetical protein
LGFAAGAYARSRELLPGVRENETLCFAGGGIQLCRLARFPLPSPLASRATGSNIAVMSEIVPPPSTEDLNLSTGHKSCKSIQINSNIQEFKIPRRNDLKNQRLCKAIMKDLGAQMSFLGNASAQQ